MYKNQSAPALWVVADDATDARRTGGRFRLASRGTALRGCRFRAMTACQVPEFAQRLHRITGAKQGADVIDRQRSGDLDGDDLVVATELPIEQTPALRVAILDALVINEISGL